MNIVCHLYVKRFRNLDFFPGVLPATFSFPLPEFWRLFQVSVHLEMVQIRRIGRTVDLVCMKHDVAMRSSWVYYFSPSPNIVRGEVEMDDFVVIYEVLVQ